MGVGNKSWDWERELGVGDDPMTSAIPYRELSFQDYLVYLINAVVYSIRRVHNMANVTQT